MGFLLVVSDYDDYAIPNLHDSGWATKEVLLYPQQAELRVLRGRANLRRVGHREVMRRDCPACPRGTGGARAEERN